MANVVGLRHLCADSRFPDIYRHEILHQMDTDEELHSHAEAERTSQGRDDADEDPLLHGHLS